MAQTGNERILNVLLTDHVIVYPSILAQSISFIRHSIVASFMFLFILVCDSLGLNGLYLSQSGINRAAAAEAL